MGESSRQHHHSSHRGDRKKREQQPLDGYEARRSQLTVSQYFEAVELSRSHRQHKKSSKSKDRTISSRHHVRSRQDRISSERGAMTSISISDECFRRCAILMMISFFAIASINFIILPSHFHLDTNSMYGENPQIAKSRWTQRKISSVKANVLPAEKQQVFRIGRLFGRKKNQNEMQSSQKVEDEEVSEEQIQQSPQQSPPADKLKRKKLLYGTKHVPETTNWPPLSALIGSDGNIRDDVDVSGLLDFAIIGFGKTGTTSLLRHLSEMTDSLSKEHCDLVVNNSGQLLKDLYEDHGRRIKQAERNHEELEDRLRGMKCPQDISSDNSIVNYAKYFPSTKLIIGIRHPVRWFESLYNFRVTNVPWKQMPATSELTRGCHSGSQGVCAWRANFHDFLSRLGKTPMSSASEKQILQLGLDRVKSNVGPVFLYEVSQLSESDNDGGVRSTQFRTDLKRFLGLQQEIPPFPRVDTSGRFDFLPGVKHQINRNKIDICQPKHDIIRKVLMEKAKLASTWIREYFLESDEVFVSSRDHFELILESWMHDPCSLK